MIRCLEPSSVWKLVAWTKEIITHSPGFGAGTDCMQARKGIISPYRAHRHYMTE